jgi:squalene synthase HpnC
MDYGQGLYRVRTCGRSVTSSLSSRPCEGLRAKERAENFPVALLALPRAYRRDLRAIYDVVRVIDDLGDDASGDRSTLLRDFAADLTAAWNGESAGAEPVRQLLPVIRRRRLSLAPFEQLVEANLMDQTVSSYQRFDDLVHYCSLSAAPIGRMVLEVFDQASPERVAGSDRVCTALQLLEHWQDVAEDYRAGRTYLPQEDLTSFGVTAADLSGSTTSAALRRLIQFETNRANELLEAGPPLVASLRGWARLAVAGYVAGGRATVQALHRADGDVMPGPPRPRRRDLLRQLAVGLARSTR